MQGSIARIPYEDVSFRLLEDGTLDVTCPWLHLQLEVTPELKLRISGILTSAAQEPMSFLSPEGQDWLQNFTDFPLLQSRPRSDLMKAGVYESKAFDILQSQGPKDFLSQINPFSDIDVASALAYFPDEWTWDSAVVAEEALIKGSDLYDPEAAYMAIRRMRLMFQVNHSADAQAVLTELRALQKTDEHAFYETMALVLAQQYYVTGQCCTCLGEARDNLTMMQAEIDAYQAEEMHHDRLILASIQQLTTLESSRFTYAPEVRLEIEAIRYAARTCALGFAAQVSIMEGTVYPENDPVGEILRASSKPESHRGVEAHFQINKQSNHTAIPETFVQKIPAVTRRTIESAVRLAEVTIRLDTGLSKFILSRLRSR